MLRRTSFLVGVFVLAVFVALGSTSVSRAESQKQPGLADSAFDLVNAVNALRASYGLAPYSINSILMYTAQAQADFLAATGSMTHSGPGGIGLTDRLLAAGYPLAGFVKVAVGMIALAFLSGGVFAWLEDSKKVSLSNCPRRRMTYESLRIDQNSRWRHQRGGAPIA
jgi:uncharacterized protein YkwD